MSLRFLACPGETIKAIAFCDYGLRGTAPSTTRMPLELSMPMILDWTTQTGKGVLWTASRKKGLDFWLYRTPGR
jgi:hypothetical protein